MANILLSGATMGSNFGDFLFAHLFYNKIRELNTKGDTYFYESKYVMSGFFKTNLCYKYDFRFSSLRNADLLVYISGGFFGERTSDIKEHIIRFLRYMLVGSYFVIMGKPIVIIGVGAGPLSSILLRFFTKIIFNHASLVSVRDEESKSYLQSYGVRNIINVTSDSAQVLSPDYYSTDIRQYLSGELNSSSKYLFLHINPTSGSNDGIIAKIIRPLNRFLEEHSEYEVIIGCDQYSKSIVELHNVKKHIVCKNILLYHYVDPLSLCVLLNKVDCIITTKLHVGIIGATFSKSVISVPDHSEKILRYYRQIGEIDRTIPLIDCNDENLSILLKKYYNKPIILSEKIRNAALLNFILLKNFLIDFLKRNKNE